MSHEKPGRSGEWYTPKYIFEALECKFDIDVAASYYPIYSNVPANKYFDHDSLNKSWEGFVWMNPPFGGRNGLIPWLDKFFRHGNGIALTPDRTSAPWWQRASEKCDAVLFIAGKVKFVRPDGSLGQSPSNGTTLFAKGEKAVAALITAAKNNLGQVYLKSNPL